MFGIEKNVKAREQLDSARQMLVEVEDQLEKAGTDLSRHLEVRDRLCGELAETTLPRFDDAYLPVKNVHFKGSEIAYTDYGFESIGAKCGQALHKPEPLAVPELKNGASGAFLIGLFTALLVVSAAALVYAFLEGIDPILLPMHLPLAAFGAGALLFLAVFAVTAIPLYRRRAVKNMVNAQKLFHDAERRHFELMDLLHKTVLMDAFVTAQAKTLRTLQVFLDECSSKLVRIVYTEGEVYPRYSDTSKGDVRMAVELYHALRTLLKTGVVDRDGSVKSEAQRELDEAGVMAERLMRPYRSGADKTESPVPDEPTEHQPA